MRKRLLFFFAVLFFAPAAFAADGTPSRALPSSLTGGDATPRSVDTTSDAATTSRAAISRNAMSVATSAPASETNSTPITSSASNTTASRTATISRVVNTNQTNATANVSPRDGATTISRSAGVSRALATQDNPKESSARETLEATVSHSGMNSRVSAAGINNSGALRRAGVTLRPTVAEVGGRATIAGTDMQTGSNLNYTNNSRAVSSRAATTQLANRETIAEAKDRLEQTASLNKSCQEQYNECMDQFCAVIDANQKRCSCSANLSRYTKVEKAVKEANTQLNEVAQRIRYVGLSADEIRAILTATEAEDALTGTRDTTESRNMLEAIENMIKDPTSSSFYASDTYSGLDLDLDFSGDIDDIFSLDFLTNTTGSFSNLRGTELYNAAKKRCNTIITQCKEVGATAQQITGNYDLAIDKDCIAYEQGLNKMNETLLSNVGSANRMLQKARLAVLQNKNQYDAKGCIGALDACMTDDMVCGADYEKCLDPTKKFIDENGNVVLGQDITQIRDFMKNYNNASIDSTLLSRAYGMGITETTCKATTDSNNVLGNNGTCNIKYLLTKIGTKQKSTDEGLCRPVLDKCQRYTYDNNGNYKSFNDIIVNYIQRAMVNIKAGQEKIISDYASTCMTDIATCYNQQVTQVNAWSSSASIGSIYNVMRGACRNVALTCAYAVFDADTTSCPTGSSGVDTCINNISEMFYQSLLCPDNSDYVTGSNNAVDANGTPGGYVNARCKCRTGYDVWGSQCLIQCGTGAERNSYGTCSCQDGYKMDSIGNCVVQN